jgi:hypothetical protein
MSDKTLPRAFGVNLKAISSELEALTTPTLPTPTPPPSPTQLANESLMRMIASREAVAIVARQKGETHATLLSTWTEREIQRLLDVYYSSDSIKFTSPFMEEAFGAGFNDSSSKPTS